MRLSIKTTHAPLVFKSIVVDLSSVDHCIRVRELSSWTPNFLTGFKDEEGKYSVNDNNSRYDQESEDDSSVYSVSDTYGNENKISSHRKETNQKEAPDVFMSQLSKAKEQVYSDPFHLALLIEKFLILTGKGGFQPERLARFGW
ncbi:hypothetical protein Tco_0520650 [Tanacetum coccineum]